MAEPEGVLVNLMPFWLAQDQLRLEHERLADYTAARDFWASYDDKLRESVATIDQVRKDMEANTGWKPGNPREASTAFYERVDAGTKSIRTWLGGGTAEVRQAFGDVVDQLPARLRALDEHANWLRQQDKVVGTDVVPAPELLTVPRTEKITDQDRGWVRIPRSTANQIHEVVTTAVRMRDELRDMFTRTRDALAALPQEKWLGPTSLATGAPPGDNPLSTGTGDQPAGPGPTGTGPTGTGPTGGPTGTGPVPTGPTGTPGPQAPGPTSTPDTGTTPPGTDLPGTGRPGGPTAPVPGLDPTTGPNGSPPPTPSPTPLPTPLPTSDPQLAGTPTATLPSPTPLSPLSPSQSTPVLPTPLPGGVSSGSSLPASTLGATTLPPTSSALPPLSNFGSTVDGSRGPVPPRTGTAPSGPVTSSPVAGEASVRPAGGPTGAGSGGFYPPMVPPMMPPGGVGAGAGGVRPGEAEFGGGPIRQRGRESWRAGLRPGLLGRAADRDDEWAPEPPARPRDDILDEELWQVPGAAPVAPPEQPPRRARPWET
jgi:hypothetical protein